MSRPLHIVWKLTKLGCYYPTMDGRDVFHELWKQCGLRFSDAPVFDFKSDAADWAKRHGFTYGFDVPPNSR